MTATDLLEISHVLCPTKLASSFGNTSDVTGTAVRKIWQGSLYRVECTYGASQGLCPIDFQDAASIAYTLAMNSSNEEKPVKLLSLGRCLNNIGSRTYCLTCNLWADGGGIRGLSELLIVQEVMHKIMIEKNKKLKLDGQPPLTCLPRPCDHFDLIGGTSTGGRATCFWTWYAPAKSYMTG